MGPRGYPQLPVRAKLALAPWLLVALLLAFIADEWGLIDLPDGQPARAYADVRRAPSERPSPAVQVLAARLDIPPGYLASYQAAARSCPGLSWTTLAAVGKVETNHGRGWPPRWRHTPGIAPGTENFAGAGGPMQFIASTWRQYGHGDRWDPADAIPAAARYLCASGVRRHQGRALHAYNRSWAYVHRVQAIARRYAAGRPAA